MDDYNFYDIIGKIDNDFLISCYNGNLDDVKRLIRQGATKFSLGVSKAALGGHFDIVKYLIDECGANHLNDCLWVAADKGYFEIFKYLVKNGADYMHRAEHHAMVKGNDKILEFINIYNKKDYDKMAQNLIKIMLRDI